MKAIKSRTTTKHLKTTLSMLLFLLAGSLYSQNLNSIHDNPGASANTIPSSQIGFEALQSAAVPFDQNTLISYSMPVAMDVEFKVFDKLGRELTTLVNEIQSPGSHTITLKTANLKAGIYFYMLSMGGYTEVKKIAIVK
jgi:hypothetical protein